MLKLIYRIPIIYRKVILIFYSLSIITLTLIPSQDIPKVPLFEGGDKLIHILMYLGLSFLVMWAFISKPSKKSTLIIFISLAFFGYLLEFIQLEMKAGRSFSVWDGLANIFGIVIGILFYSYFLKRNNRDRTVLKKKLVQ